MHIEHSDVCVMYATLNVHKLNRILTALVDLCCSFEGRVSPGSSGLSVAVMYKTYSLNVS